MAAEVPGHATWTTEPRGPQRPRWEYLLLQWSQEAVRNGGIRSRFHLWRGFGNGPAEIAVDDFTAYLNILGADGWELVSESTRNTAEFDVINGFPRASAPISVFWTFKRMVY